ncbi:metal-dependent hydrolase [Erysipelotrichaceae bacterium]|nr:metal-dependent hydrolase [Erysipelotrichaceae bacterium]
MYTYCVKINKRSKKLILRVMDDKIIVTAPPYATKKVIDAFVDTRENWIREQLENRDYTSFQDIKSIYLYGLKHGFKIEIDDRKSIKIIKDDVLIVMSVPTVSTDEQMIFAFKRWLKKQAEDFLEQRITYLQQQPEVFEITSKYLKKYRVRYLKSAFGLCYARRNEIVLNAELVQYDAKILDYVILHEISHFIEQNHSKAFYDVFETLEPEWKSLKKELDELHKKMGGWSYR